MYTNNAITMQIMKKMCKWTIFISEIKISALVMDWMGSIFCLYGTSPPLAYINHYKFQYLFPVNYSKTLEVFISFNASLIKASRGQSQL
ncbi:hypothetical protein TOT_010000439 [Theileria orientalis strain Shintoku]|uniref:Uncharacterized protein n=1 Tax=Theileria orientalis strain Shintoku TaxID=869250 RepID=J4DNH6_THEOR|nr:hypothetical protein TOT_010000439 [Theileria orientalis strain Shintoku]BAM38974.1 hypothetical protein TOT_010000439 [Theileria orientalis strain Shintoku]|eukprot:XP_009689275.1 hypothetical protein TOT_010000439 [Theileria orientalis strain Shintoku]